MEPEGIGARTPQQPLAFLPVPVWDMAEGQIGARRWGEGHTEDTLYSLVLGTHGNMRCSHLQHLSAEKVKPGGEAPCTLSSWGRREARAVRFVFWLLPTTMIS